MLGFFSEAARGPGGSRGARRLGFLGVLCLLVAAFLVPQSAAAQMTAPDGVWLRVGWFAPVTSFPSQRSDTEGSVRLDSRIAFGASAEWTVRPAWSLAVGLAGSSADPVPTATGASCEFLQEHHLPCSRRDLSGGQLVHGHVALVRHLDIVRVGLGVGPRLLRLPERDCALIGTNILCALAGDMGRQHTVTVMGTGIVGVEHTLRGRGVRLDLQHGVSVHRGSVQQELVLSGGVRVFR